MSHYVITIIVDEKTNEESIEGRTRKYYIADFDTCLEKRVLDVIKELLDDQVNDPSPRTIKFIESYTVEEVS
jgi:hypothetical protein